MLSNTRTSFILFLICIELTKKINFLKYDINLTTKQTTRILSSWPKYLSYSYIKLKYCKNFLINNVYHLTNDELSKIIYTLPQILAYSVDENLKCKLIFFCKTKK